MVDRPCAPRKLTKADVREGSAEFLESPSDPLHLLLPVKDIVRSLG